MSGGQALQRGNHYRQAVDQGASRNCRLHQKAPRICSAHGKEQVSHSPSHLHNESDLEHLDLSVSQPLAVKEEVDSLDL